MSDWKITNMAKKPHDKHTVKTCPKCGTTHKSKTGEPCPWCGHIDDTARTRKVERND